MKPFRFSPIKDKSRLFKAIEHIHFESFRFCKQNLGYYLPRLDDSNSDVIPFIGQKTMAENVRVLTVI